MIRAFSWILMTGVCLCLPGCGGSVREPASSTSTAPGAFLDVRAAILRAEDRRVVDQDLLAALDHDQPGIRRLAVRALGRIGDDSRIEQLRDATADRDPGVRAAAAFALGLLGGDESLEAMLRLTDDGSPEVRAIAATACGLIATEKAESAIGKLLRDEDPSVVTRACFSVPRFARPGFAVEQLEELTRSEVGDVIFSCTWALAELAARPERLDRASRLLARGRMIELTESRFPVLRRMAARGLTIPTREEEAASVGPLVEDTEPAVRIAAIRAISFPGAPLEPFLTKVLDKGEEEDDRVYLALVDALGNLRGPEVIAKLADIVVFDPRMWVKERAIHALGRASELSVKMANGLSKSQDDVVRRATPALLIGRLDEESLEWARRLYADPDPAIRAAIIPAFGELDGVLSETLADALDSDDPRVRRAIAVAAGRALADRPDDPAVVTDALDLLAGLWQTAVDTGDTALAAAVLRAAGRAAPNERARELLETGLDHEIWQVRLVAAEQLEQAFDIDASEELGPATGLPIEEYREIAGWAARPHAAIVTVERPGFLPGRFTIRFDAESAPLSAYRFARQAEQGAYDDLPVHRVVPEVALFTGDGSREGRELAAFDARDELDDHLFLSGTLVWDSTDTDRIDGAWLVTLTPQPELMGSKTAFARVVQNFAGVVSQVLPLDRIKSIEIYEGDGSEPLPPLED